MKSLLLIYTLVIVTGVGAYAFVTSGLGLVDPKPYGYQLQVKPRTGEPLSTFQVQGDINPRLQVTSPVQATYGGLQGNSEDSDTLQPALTAHNY